MKTSVVIHIDPARHCLCLTRCLTSISSFLMVPMALLKATCFIAQASISKNASATTLCLWPRSTLSPCNGGSEWPCQVMEMVLAFHCLPSIVVYDPVLNASYMVYCEFCEVQGLIISSFLEDRSYVVQ